MNKSPSISIIERDMSTYTVTSASTALAVVGYATKGPIGVPTTVTSLRDFRDTFGGAALLPYSYLAVVKAFNQTNKVIFTRVADSTATTSQRAINNIIDQVNGYATLVKTTDVSPIHSGYNAGEMYGLTVNARECFISSKASGGWGLDDVVSKLNDELEATSGFQEFTLKSFSALASTRLYGFTLTVDNGSKFGEKSVLIEVNNTDNIATIAAKINLQLASGTRSYATTTMTMANASTLSSNTYSFKAKVGSSFSSTEYIVTFPAALTATSYTEIAYAMNTACANATLVDESQRIGVIAMNNSSTYSLCVYAKSLGTIGDITIEAGTTGSNLLAAGTPSVVLGGAWTYITGAGSSSGFTVEKHIDTGRLRITSASTGANSRVSIAAPTAPFANSDCSLVTFLDSAMTAYVGKDVMTTPPTITRDLLTRKIVFTSENSTTSPTLASLTNEPAYYSLSILLGGIENSNTANGTSAVTVATSDKIIIESLEKGSATSLIVVEKTTYTNPLTSETTVNLEVLYDNVSKETFSGMSLDTTADNFIENIVNASSEDGGSSWINITCIDTVSGVGNTTVVFPDGTYYVGTTIDADNEQAYDDTHTSIGTYDYRVGTDGIPSIGGEEMFIEALQTSSDLANDEVFNFHILITPDNTSEAVQAAAISLAEYRQDFMYVVDTPFGYTYVQAKNWHNGDGGLGRNNAVNSSYAAVYWPWLKEYDTDNAKYVWCPPSVFVAEKYLEVDRTYNPWYAPAGDVRGRIIAQDIETSPSLAQREILYGDLNCVNPIVKFNTQGIEIYGQKTAIRQLVASNRINVKRMLIYIKKLIKISLNSMIFEPNNPDSWQVATNLVTGILEPIRQDNGLSQYKVVINGTVNTPDVVAQNQMKGIIKLVPTNTIEMIEMNINVYKTGTTIT